MKRFALFACALFALLSLGAFSVFAEEDIEKEYSSFVEALPGSLNEKLPFLIGKEGAQKDAEALTDWNFIVAAVADALGVGIGRILPMLASILGLLLISSAAEAFRGTLKAGALLSVCTTCAVGAAAIALQYEILAGAAQYLHDLCSLINALLPLTVSLYAAGGNVAAASVSGGAFGVFLNICENVLAKSIMPFAGICLSLSLTGCVSSHINLKGISGVIKKTYTTFLAFVMSIFSFVLAAQNAIAAGADSISMRAAKFVAGSLIPVLGGSVGESFRTFAAGIGVLRRSIGVCGIVLIFLLFLPTLISLLLLRTVNGLASGFATLLGCKREGALLAEISSVYGYICGVVSMCSLMFVFALTLLVGAVSIAG